MLSVIILCNVWCLLTALDTFNQTSVSRFSVPEKHVLCLHCSDSDIMIWTHRDRKVIATKQGNHETTDDRNKYRLLTGGSLCVLELEQPDSGEYRCNDHLVAEVEVLTGHDFTVSAGRTLLLPCRSSSKPKQRWFYRRGRERREAIFTRFKNGTVKREREDTQGRFTFDQDALQILDLQPGDAGDYLCNGEVEATVIVLAAHPEQTSIQPTSITPTTPTTGTNTDVVERQEKRSENALVMVAVIGSGVMILLMTLVCVLLISMKCRRKRKHGGAAAGQRQDNQLQPWTSTSRPIESEAFERPGPVEETIHYASLGRPNWRDRQTRTQSDQNHHHVIYSSVITRPTGK